MAVKRKRVRRGTGQAWVRTGEPLLWLMGAGRERRGDAAYFYDAGKRGDRLNWVLQLTLGGAGFFERQGRRVLLTEGMAFLHTIPGDFRYGYPVERKDPYELVFVNMGGEAGRWCERIVAAHGHVLRFGKGLGVGPLMLNIVQQREGALRDRYLASAQLYQLLMTVVSSLSAARLAMEPLVRRALELIGLHAPEHGFDVRMLAARLGCSREHLARQFRAAMGVSPSDYILQQRLRIGAEGLRAGVEKLETIARGAGFAGANYFVRAFRQRVGVTPAEFRRRVTLVMP